MQEILAEVILSLVGYLVWAWVAIKLVDIGVRKNAGSTIFLIGCGMANLCRLIFCVWVVFAIWRVAGYWLDFSIIRRH